MPPVPPSMPPVPPVQTTGSTGPHWPRLPPLGQMALTAIGYFCVFAFLVSLVGIGGYSERSSVNRFDPRFAEPAATNAMEYIARNVPSSSAASWLICFLLVWLIVAVERLRITLTSR